MASRSEKALEDSPPVSTLDQQFEAFEASYPEVAEALRIFDLSFAWYETAILAMDGPTESVSSSTERTIDAYLD